MKTTFGCECSLQKKLLVKRKRQLRRKKRADEERENSLKGGEATTYKAAKKGKPLYVQAVKLTYSQHLW
jgi:hypothetical protein